MREYIEMKDMVTGELVTVVKTQYVDKLGFWSTVEYVQDSITGELTPKWQYRHKLVAV